MNLKKLFVLRILFLIPFCLLPMPLTIDEINYLAGTRAFVNFVIFLKIFQNFEQSISIIKITLMIISSASIFSMYIFARCISEVHAKKIAIAYAFNPFIMYFSVRILTEPVIYFGIPLLMWAGYERKFKTFIFLSLLFVFFKWSVLFFTLLGLLQFKDKMKVLLLLSITHIPFFFLEKTEHIRILLYRLEIGEPLLDITLLFGAVVLLVPFILGTYPEWKLDKQFILVCIMISILFLTMTKLNDYIRLITISLVLYCCFIRRLRFTFYPISVFVFIFLIIIRLHFGYVHDLIVVR